MALVRVKRRLTDDPVDALLVTTKRLKKDDLQATVFQFAATVKKNEDAASVIKRVVSSSNVLKQNVPNVEKLTQKLREEIKNNSAANRLKVVNCFRSLDFALDGDTADRPLTVVEIETRAQEISTEDTASAEPSTSVSNTPGSATNEVDANDYVIDLYYTSSLDICDSSVDNILSAIPLGNDVLFQDHHDDSNEECYGDDEDSNDENHWRNDYPDEDEEDISHSSIDEDDMRRVVFQRRKNCRDSSGECSDDLSSEDEEVWYGDSAKEKYTVSDTDSSTDSPPLRTRLSRLVLSRHQP